MTRITTLPDVEAVARRAAGDIALLLEGAREQRGRAHVALSGGNTPARTYELLAETVSDWSGIEIWFADERCVPPDDERSNYLLAANALLRPAAIAEEQVHRMRGERGPREGARLYAEELRAGGLDMGERHTLDVAVLGIGPEGHIASLFPEAPALGAGEEELCVGVEDSPKPPPQRITLTLPALRAAWRCLVIATGAEKTGAISAMLGDATERVPASLLRRERLSVIVDDAASGAPGEPWLTPQPVTVGLGRVHDRPPLGIAERVGRVSAASWPRPRSGTPPLRET
jgi:6-phosphogluconolactonase